MKPPTNLACVRQDRRRGSRESGVHSLLRVDVRDPIDLSALEAAQP